MSAVLHPARAGLADRLGLVVRLSAADIGRFAAAAGVSVRALRTARRGLPVAVDAHLGLCRALRLDPATGERARRVEPCGRVRWDHVRASLVCTRTGAGLTLRAAAERIGIGAATLLRAERGEAVSVETFLAIAAWLGMPPAHLTDAAPCWRVGVAPRRRGPRACGAAPSDPAAPGHLPRKGGGVSRVTGTETGAVRHPTADCLLPTAEPAPQVPA